MRTDEKIRVLEVWRKNPFSNLSRMEIMKSLNKKTKTWIFNTLKHLVKNKILNSNRKSNLDIYSLNLSNPISLKILDFLEIKESINFERLDLISDIINKIPVKGYCLIVFGSYAENKQKKDSDIDISILINNKEDEKKIKPYLNDIKLNYKIKVDDHYILFNEFIEMLTRSEENLGKQIFRKHKIFYNSDIYYNLIKEAYKNGFRP
ncbi:nucleotidyltransferase domain-containing protein [Candidatus Woesearchaeota archaeon]|nr:nucleotidyltransferase domain-containing protein [Candidatus Woesearchaeota archaeon]